MRTKRLPALGGTTNYTVGTRVGQPSKVLPPDFPNGKTPSAKYAAQWQNYIEYWMQQQIEASAALPYQNWFSVASPQSFNSTLSPGLAFNPQSGATAITSNTSNAIYIVDDIQKVQNTRTLAPATGVFIGKDIAYDKFAKAWWVVGSNSTATSKTIWTLTGGTQTETTAPAAGSVDRVAVDKTTGLVYAFMSDTNRTVLQCSNVGVWTVHSTRGSGFGAPTSVAVNNGEMLVAYGAGNALQVYTAGAWTTRTDVAVSGDTFKKVYYSTAQQVWYCLGNASGFSVMQTAAAGTFTSTVFTGSDNLAVAGSTLHEMGYANPGSASTAYYIQIAPDLPPLAQAYDNYQNHLAWTGSSVHFDGSAIFILAQLSGGQAVYRSLRSNAPLTA